MSKRGRGPGPLPKRWLNCPRKSLDTIVGKFVAFKTPLSEAFDDQVPLENRFYPFMVFDFCKTQKIKLGLWIDLTNTSRFYDKNEVKNKNCMYKKLSCQGHGETPSKEQTKLFVSLVDTFIRKHPLECIAVHCTHGFNRTGFLIVSYLVEKEDCSIENALELYAKVRPPGIYKGDYIEELYRRYDDVNDTPPPPQLPSWCFDSDDVQAETDSGYSETSESNPSSSQYEDQKRKKRFKADTGRKQPVFMEGVPGVTFFNEQPKAYNLQRKVQAMCGWKNKGFPGSQPVSMDIHNLQLLTLKPYRVSWKADGTRYMMLIAEKDEVYFFDRDHCIFKVEGLYFPYRKELRHITNTLLDGEMVIDKVNGVNIPRYLAYDIIVFDGQDVGKRSFDIRLNCIENEIIKPRIMAMEHGYINKALEPFSIRNKQFWHITQAVSLLGEKFAKTLSHEPDGLIFQPVKEPYTPGSCDSVLKWKPIELNSVDFRLKIVKEEGLGIVSKKVGRLFVGQCDTPFAIMKYTKDIKDLDNQIIECKFEDNQWKFMRVRTDKSFPNSYNTATAVCDSIKNPVTKEKLLECIAKYRFNDDTAVMPPPPPYKAKR